MIYKLKPKLLTIMFNVSFSRIAAHGYHIMTVQPFEKCKSNSRRQFNKLVTGFFEMTGNQQSEGRKL